MDGTLRAGNPLPKLQSFLRTSHISKQLTNCRLIVLSSEPYGEIN